MFGVVFLVFLLLAYASTHLRGQVEIGASAIVILLSLPNGLVEGYGIYQAIKEH